MRAKPLTVVVILLLSLFISIGCVSNAEPQSQEGITVQPTPTIDFDQIPLLKKAEGKQPIDKISKLVFIPASDVPVSSFVYIDLGRKALYSSPMKTFAGLKEADILLSDDDIVTLRSILNKYSVQSWDEDYSSSETNYVDGFNWSLIFIYEDSTTEMHGGSGIVKGDVTPENFDAFADELLAFAQAIENR